MGQIERVAWTNIYTTSVKQLASGNLLYNRDPSLALCDDLERGGGWAGRAWEGSSRGSGYTHTHTHMHIHVHTHTHMHASALAHTCTLTHTHTYMHTHAHTHMHR